MENIKLTNLLNNNGQIDGLPKNPRLIKGERFEKLKKSIQDDPEMLQLRELLVYPYNDKFVVIGGNMRLKAMKELGYKEAPCKVIDASTPPEKLRAYTIKDNVGYGEHDIDLLANDWNVEELKDWGVEDIDFDIENIQPEETEGDDDIPESAPTVTVKGDLYELGEHRLLCGDSTLVDDVEKLMNGEKADMVFTDPPYNIDYDFSNNGMVQTGQRTARFDKIKNDKMSNSEFDDFINKVFSNLLLIMNEGASYYISAGRESTITFNKYLKDLDFHIQSWLIWVKENFNISRLDYHPRHEVITYGWKKGKAHQWFSDRSQTDVLNISREKAGEAVHPTQKPIELLKYLINNSSKKDHLVADFFGGSGSTLIACEKTNRKCYGMELDEKYCDVIVKRYIDFCKKNDRPISVKRNGEDCLNEFEN